MKSLLHSMKMFYLAVRYLIYTGAAWIVSFLISSFDCKKTIWLISERGTDARDNGYFFFKWLCHNRPEIKSYYVISKDSPDRNRVTAVGRAVTLNSCRHFYLFARSQCLISTHAAGGDIPCVDFYKKFGFEKKSRKKRIFLQHGIIKDFLPNLCYPKFKTDLFVCGAKPEYDYIKAYYGHPEGVVQYTGLARYDNLAVTEPKRQILLMPTFRKWIQKMDREAFLKSDYYCAWQTVLDSKELNAMLEKEDMVLIFYPHYEIQHFVDCFRAASSRIEIAHLANYDVQTLLIESSLLVTDFSSVFFDIAYMKKPMVYYQFDRDRYIREHYDYTKGYFDYDTMGFGNVVFDEEALIQEIFNAVKRDFQVDSVYETRRQIFFPTCDTHNCERIFASIQNLI